MAFLDQFDANSTRQRAASASWSDTASQKPSRRLAAPIWISGILIVLAGTLVWVFRSQVTIPSALQRTVPDEPSAAPISATPATPATVPPPRALVQPQAPRRGARTTPLPAIAIVPPNGGSQVDVNPSEASANKATALPKPPALRGDAVRDLAPAVPAGLYSAADADVTPPEPIRQRSFSVPPAGVPPENVVTIDFVVNERGIVESAKVKGEPRSVGESLLFAMSLQALKSWQFRPALKDGSPVRYRQSRSFGGMATQLPPHQ